MKFEDMTPQEAQSQPSLLGDVSTSDSVPVIRVRFCPKDTDETFDGTVVGEEKHYYIVKPDQGFPLRQNWNKKYCKLNHENGNDANRLLAAVPLKPRSGVWGDDDIYKAYKDLVKELGELMPEETIGLHISGAAAKCRSKAKMIKAKATILEDMVKAVCVGR